MRRRWDAARVAVVLMAILVAGAARAEVEEPTPRSDLAIPDAARPGPGFDVESATQAYLATLGDADRARSDAYFEGGYWLPLVGLLYDLAVVALLLELGISRRLRDLGERAVRWRFVQSTIYGAALVVVAAVLELPLAFWVGFVREHAYGLSNLTAGAWAVVQVKGLGASLVLAPPAVAVVHAVVRRRAGRWWIPATATAMVFLVIGLVITPVFLAPVFNDYRPLRPGPVRDAIVSMVRANGIDAEDVYWFDASKQTKRISANVSGALGTTRISLNDNLLREASLPEIEAVVGHELGHDVLHHIGKMVLQLALLMAAGFAVSQHVYARLLRWRGLRWGLRDGGDIAGLPLVALLISAWFVVMTPALNTIVRTAESEADLFGLNAAREPHAFASVAVKLASYRKLAPTALEEAIFYDHPSGVPRVRMAMTWFREHPDAGAGGTRASPP
ncbi:MAG: M48 family metalloprotease [Deltaproteobacteria bacterium]|nr:M48 family metalloprotease [Deltaproteobacteria bacterium]